MKLSDFVFSDAVSAPCRGEIEPVASASGNYEFIARERDLLGDSEVGYVPPASEANGDRAKEG